MLKRRTTLEKHMKLENNQSNPNTNSKTPTLKDSQKDSSAFGENVPSQIEE